MEHAQRDGVRVCTTCRLTMVGRSRCPRCKHPTIDPSTAMGRAALDAWARRARVGRRALFGSLVALAAALASALSGHLGAAEGLAIAGALTGLVAVALGGRLRAPAPLSPLPEQGEPPIDGPDGVRREGR